MLHPSFIISILEVVSGVSSSGLFSVFGRNDGLSGLYYNGILIYILR